MQFSSAAYSAKESDNFTQVTVTRSGNLSRAFTVDYAAMGGTASGQRNYITALGTLSFAASETTKTFTVLLTNNQYVEGSLILNLALSSATNGAILGTPASALLTIADNSTGQPTTNSMDDPPSFVREQYHDFLNREPDAAGLAYWTQQITNCGTNQSCINRKRTDVAAAFFIEQEFQQTGFYAYRLFVATFGRAPTYLEFVKAVSQVKPGATPEENKQAMLTALVESEEVKQLHATMNNRQYVDTTLANTHLVMDISTHDQMVTALDSNQQTRADILSQVVEIQAFVDAEYNKSFVLMQYFGYLRRDPDTTGYNFWVDVLNTKDANNFRGMVCAFTTSAEFQQRFSSVVTRTDKTCWQ